MKVFAAQNGEFFELDHDSDRHHLVRDTIDLAMTILETRKGQQGLTKLSQSLV